MKVDTIILLNENSVFDVKVVADEMTAEAEFDCMLEKIIEDNELDSYDDITRNAIDYGVRLINANRYLSSFGFEIVWLSGLKVDKYKN